MRTIKILFICTGNICRSPTAEGVLRHLITQAGLESTIEIDSAGTSAYHVGEAPDPRSQAAAKARNIDISQLQARAISIEDFNYYDYILAMDEYNYYHLRKLCPAELVTKIGLFMDYAPALKRYAVPDPYYGGPQGFDLVLDLITVAAQGLLTQITANMQMMNNTDVKFKKLG